MNRATHIKTLPGGTITTRGIVFNDDCTREQHAEIGKWLGNIDKTKRILQMRLAEKLERFTKAELQRMTGLSLSKDRIVFELVSNPAKWFSPTNSSIK